MAPGLAEKLLKLEQDPDPKVRFQLLLTLGLINSPAARAAESRLLNRDVEDRWVQVAALSSASDRALALFESGTTSTKTEGRVTFFRQVCSVIGARQKDAEISKVLQKVASANDPRAEWWRAASLEGLASGMRRWDKRPRLSVNILLKLFSDPSPSVRRASLR